MFTCLIDFNLNQTNSPIRLRSFAIRVSACVLILTFQVFNVARAQSIRIDSLRSCAVSSSVDSTKTKCTRLLAVEFSRLDMDSMLFYGRKTYELAVIYGLEREKAYALGIIAHAQLYRGYSDSAIFYYNQSIPILKRLGDEDAVATELSGISNALREKGKYSEAIQYLNKSLKIREHIHDSTGVAMCYHAIGSIYLLTERFDEAIASYQQALEIARAIDQKVGVAMCLNNLGNVFGKQKKYKKALERFHEVLPFLKELGDKPKLAATYSSMAVAYEYTEEYSKAMQYQLLALGIMKQINKSDGIINSYIALGSTESKQGHFESSFQYLDSALILAKERGNLHKEMLCYEYLAEAAAFAGDYKAAYNYRIDFAKMKDSLINVANNEQVADLRMQYETEKKERQIKELEQKEALAQSLAEKRNYQVIGAVSIALLLLVVVLMLIFRQRFRRKQRETEFALRAAELEQKVLRSQMNPHFIFNSLNSIHRMYVEGKYDVADEYVGEFGGLLRKILENSNKKSISIANELEMLRSYLELEQLRTDGKIQWKIDVDHDIDQYNTHLPPLILQPFVENAIWHGILPKGEKGKVTVQLKMKDESTLECVVQDNGIGIDDSKRMGKKEKHDSMGMDITKERIGRGGKVKAVQLAEGGTRVTITIPLET